MRAIRSRIEEQVSAPSAMETKRRRESHEKDCTISGRTKHADQKNTNHQNKLDSDIAERTGQIRATELALAEAAIG